MLQIDGNGSRSSQIVPFLLATIAMSINSAYSMHNACVCTTLHNVMQVGIVNRFTLADADVIRGVCASSFFQEMTKM